MIVVIGLVKKDSFSFFSFLTPMKFAVTICLLGTLGFIVKVILYKIEKKSSIPNKSSKIRD